MAHKHTWVARETLDHNGRTIYGYICKCGKKDYVDMTGGRPSAYKATKGMEGKVR